jgi:hypothetical protein
VSTLVSDPRALNAEDWPAGSEHLRPYALGFATLGSQRLIANVRTRMLVLRDGATLLPVTVNECEPDNSYVCSLYNAYVEYSRAELHLLPSRRLDAVLASIAALAGAALRAAAIDRLVVVNNWLLSTNLYPDAWIPDVARLTRTLVHAFPDHYICFRSLNHWTNAPLQRALVGCGYKALASRQVYMYDRLVQTWEPRSNVRHDRRLLERSPYRVVQHDDLGAADYHRIASLYDWLYRRRYPAFNPAFTEDYIRLCHESRLMRFIGLRDPGGRLDGVVGLFAIGRTLTCPIVGYDLDLSRRLGLYRLLMLLPFLVAAEDGLRVNLSAGAASFKRLRGGRPVIEYSAIFDRHLAPGRRLALTSLARLVNGLGIPLLQKLHL